MIHGNTETVAGDQSQDSIRVRPGVRAGLRLLFISSDLFPPTRVDVSVLFAEELVRRGHRIDWILQSATPCEASYETVWGGGRAWVGATDLGTTVFRRLKKHLSGIANDLRLLGEVRKGNYDIVLMKDKFISALVALAASRVYRTRFVYWLSYPFPEASLLRAKDGSARYPKLYWIRGQAFRALLYRILLPASDGIFVQSEQMRRDIEKEGVASSKMVPVPMGIDLRVCNIERPAVRSLLPVGQPCVAYLGTLLKVRRLEFLVRMIAQVRETLPTARLYLVGRGEDPTDEQVIHDEAAQLGVTSAVELVGHVPQEVAFRYMQEADVCVSPLYPTPILNAGSPTKLVEYMALGRPVVANEHPEQKMLIEESGAGICVPYDVNRFADAVVRIIKSPTEAQEMGNRGREYVSVKRSYVAIADLVEAQLMRIARTQ